MRIKGYPLPVAARIAGSRAVRRLRPALPDRYRLYRAPGGRIYLNLRESNMMVDRAFGVYEHWKTELLREMLKPGMTCVDVGVNKGYFSLLMARLTGAGGRVLSFEPDPENRRWIERSISENGYSSIQLFPWALSDAEGEATFYPGRKSGWGSLHHVESQADPERQPFTVPLRRLDAVLPELGVGAPDVIKIDVEGADLQVLRGATGVLDAGTRVVMDVDVREREEKEELFSIFSDRGYRIYDIGATLRPATTPADVAKHLIASREPLG